MSVVLAYTDLHRHLRRVVAVPPGAHFARGDRVYVNPRQCGDLVRRRTGPAFWQLAPAGAAGQGAAAGRTTNKRKVPAIACGL